MPVELKKGHFWLICDDRKNVSTEQKVSEHIVKFKKKFGRKPNTCFVKESYGKIDSVVFIESQYISSNYFGYGVDNE